jgi:enamine deaminase RidA (YjgF/YER057c/UK114 family)
MGIDRTARYHDQAPSGLNRAPGYSQVVSSGAGRTVFVAGQTALDEQGAIVGPGDVTQQAEQVFRNIELALRAAGASFGDVVKLTYYFLDIASLPSVRPVRDRYVDTANPPAATAVEVTRLFMPGLLIEVDAVAIVQD